MAKEAKAERILLRIIEKKAEPSSTEIEFTATDIIKTAAELGLSYGNPHDLVYYFRRRKGFPESLLERGFNELKTVGKGRFLLVKSTVPPAITFPQDIAITKIPDATPQIVYERCGGNEQALLTRVRYSRLVDCFTGLSCWHLQGHYRTTVEGGFQIEIDEFYLGCNLDGTWFGIPIEAKTKRERGGIGRDQVTAMVKFCLESHPDLKCVPLVIKELDDGTILFLQMTTATRPEKVSIVNVRRYEIIRTV